jgi:hypothetical protein
MAECEDLQWQRRAAPEREAEKDTKSAEKRGRKGNRRKNAQSQPVNEFGIYENHNRTKSVAGPLPGEAITSRSGPPDFSTFSSAVPNPRWQNVLAPHSDGGFVVVGLVGSGGVTESVPFGF